MYTKLAITGHRYWEDENEKDRFIEHLCNFLWDYYTSGHSALPIDPYIFLHGCAKGVDLWFGEHALTRKISLELYLPFERKMQIVKGKFKKQHILSLNAQLKYECLLKTVVVGTKFHPRVYGKRNRILVDNCDILLTYYTRERSGSGHARRYAISKYKPIVDLYGYTNRNFCVKWAFDGGKYERPKKIYRKRAVKSI